MTILSILLAASVAMGSTSTINQPRINILYAQGEHLYQEGFYEEAISEYEQAYQLKPLPRLLIRIGDAHAKRGDLEAALTCYLRFQQQELNPVPAIREEVERRIHRLRTLLSSSPKTPKIIENTLEKPKERLAVNVVRKPDTQSLYRRLTLWGPVSLTAAGIIGVILGITLAHSNSLSGVPILSASASSNQSTM